LLAIGVLIRRRMSRKVALLPTRGRVVRSPDRTQAGPLAAPK
jgi:hypothetical protein